MYSREEAEGTRLKHPFDTVTEGMGINRTTRNFQRAHIDGAFKSSDAEAVEMVSSAEQVGASRLKPCRAGSGFATTSCHPADGKNMSNSTKKTWCERGQFIRH